MPFLPTLSAPLKAGIRTTEFAILLVLNFGSQAILAIQNEPLLSHGSVNLAKWSAGIYMVQRGVLKAIALLKGLGVDPPSNAGTGAAKRGHAASGS